MIKVIMVGNHPSNKGGMTSVINQIRNKDWTKDGIELTFIPTFLPGNAIKKSLFFVVSYFKLLFILITKKPDIVHMHMSYKGSFARKYYVHKLCKLFKVNDIVHLHGSEFEKWYNEVGEKKKNKIKKLLLECNSFIVLGEEWKEIILKIEPSTKVHVISNGIEIPPKTVQWNKNKCQVLFLGVLIPRKGVSDLIKAIEQIKLQNNLGILNFVIAGTGEEEEKLKSEVNKAGISEVVSFEGWVTGENKIGLLENSQILVSPSYNEGLPISILEAASYGMPIVSTDVGDISSVVKNKVNGVLIQPGDIGALVEGLLFVSNEHNYNSLSSESRKIIVESFSINTFYEKLLVIYHNIGGING